MKGRFINPLKRTGFSLNLKLTNFVLYNSLGLTVNALADFFAVDFKINLSGVTVSAFYKVNRAVTVIHFYFSFRLFAFSVHYIRPFGT